MEKHSKPPLIKPVHSVSFCLSVSNLDESVRWYSDVFGFKVQKEQQYPGMSVRLAFLELNGMCMELIESANFIREQRADPPLHAGKQGVSQLILEIDNVDEAAKKAKEHGITFAYQVTPVPELNMKSFLIRDNDGNIIEIFEKMRKDNE